MQTTAFLGVAHIHTPDFVKKLQNRADVQVKAVYDHDPKRAALRAGELGAEVATAEAILADPEITSVIICSETRHHLDLAVRAARAGKHLFVEKPLAFDGAEAETIANEIEAAGVVFQTGFMQRGSAVNRFIRDEIAKGHLGTITRARFTNCHGAALGGWFDTDWRWIAEKSEAGGGGLADLGAHALDILLWVLTPVAGQPVKFAGTVGSATHRYGEIDEWGVGLVTFESGAVAVVEASWVNPKLHSPVEFHGTRGQFVVNGGKVFYYSDLVPGADGGEFQVPGENLPHAFELFFDALEGASVPLVKVREAALGSHVMYELYKAAGAA